MRTRFAQLSPPAKILLTLASARSHCYSPSWRLQVVRTAAANVPRPSAIRMRRPGCQLWLFR